MFKPTKNQQSVLDTINKNIAVSASAGSGKTTLMIEKVVKIIEDENADISKFLICTFTNNAGEEMKARLYEKLSQKIASEADDVKKKHLIKNFENIELAKICTIDKFCIDIVKKYFYKLKLDPNIDILGEFDVNFLKNRAFSKTFEYYEANDKEIIDLLCTYFLQDRDLAKLKELTFKIYEYLVTMPNGKEFYYDKLASLYSKDGIHKIVDHKLKIFENRINNLISVYQNALKYLSEEDDDKLYSRLNKDVSVLNSYFNLNDENKIKFIFDLNINSVLPKSKTYDNDILKDAKNDFNEIKLDLEKFFVYSNLDSISDICLKSGEVLKILGDFIFVFAKEFEKLKKNQNQYEFYDIQHFALEILKDKDTKRDILNDIDYVFVDEYQDVNYLQEGLIDSLVKGYNLFIVGDAKQSIYGFRLCTPKILMEKSALFASEPSGFVVSLNENFRSDIQILEFTNQVFNQIMTKELSGLDYENTSKLLGSLSYDNDLCIDKVKVDILLKNDEESDEDAQVNSQMDKVYELKCENNEELNAVEREATHICNLVEQCLREKIFDTKLNEKRPVNFGDIAILFRSRKDLYKTVVNKLRDAGVPLSVSYKEDIFESMEVKFINAVLSLVMNINDDISLLTALSFPAISVTDDELAQIRVKFRDEEYFSNAVIKYISCDDANSQIVKKVNKLLNLIGILKHKMYTSTVYELVKEIEMYFDLQNILYALNNPKIIANYSKFLTEIKISKFTNLIDYLHYLSIRSENETTINLYGGENSLKCITIHESKGLEYPIVIFAGCGDSIKYRDSDICINEDGVGCDYYNVTEKYKVPTIIKRCIEDKLKKNEIEEGKRLLYVALTRAKNQLIVVGSSTITKLLKPFTESKEPCYMQFILSMLKDVELKTLFEKGELKNEYANFSICKSENDTALNYESAEDNKLSDADIMWVLSYINHEYEYKDNYNIAFKNTVSALLREENNGENYNIEPNKLLISEQTLKANEIGTIYHAILEQIDFKKEYDAKDIMSLLNGFGKDAKDVVSIPVLLDTIKDISKLVNADDEILKEQPFIFKARHCDITGSNCKEEVLVQGVIDLIIKKSSGEIIIVDYKNTNIKDAEVLKNKYEKQLFLYKYATMQVIKTDKIATYLYSIKQNELIQI